MISTSSFNFYGIKPFLKKRRVSNDGELILHQLRVRSRYLSKKMNVDVYLPQGYYNFKPHFFPVLFINDGQDMQQLGLAHTVASMQAVNEIPELIVVAIHADDRIQEYGVIGRPDYKHRGAQAGNYGHFIIKELIPYIYKNYRCLKNLADNAIAGFSLGGLSAMDLAWNNPNWFSKVGVFSGSFWWRDQPVYEHDPDAHRIMHDVLKNSTKREKLQFWLQTGTEDEKEDRNNNGVIDAIDDTLDIIKQLKVLGYADQDIEYVEIVGGEHNFKTWSKIFPSFLRWAFAEVKADLSKKSA